MGPTMCTPLVLRSRSFWASTPNTTAANAAGTIGANRRSTSNTASDAVPVIRVQPLVFPSSFRKCHICSKNSPEPPSTPNSFGS